MRIAKTLTGAALALFAVTGSPAMAQEPVPVFDMHSDILLRVIDNDVDMGMPPEWTQATIPTMRAGHVKNQVLSVWVNSNNVTGLDATQRALRMMDLFEEQAARYPESIALARSVEEADAIAGSGRIAMWLWLEGGAPIADDLAMLRTFHRLGVRGMTLTWMNNLNWAGASTDKENPEMGLTDFGKDVVREMNRLGIVVDVSHVSEATFYDALEVTTKPVVASHSSCRALCDHPRNLSDDQLRALAKNGGVAGINALPSYLSTAWEPAWDETEEKLSEQIADVLENHGGDRSDPLYREQRRQLIQANLPEDSRVTLDTYLDHIEHAIEIAGWEHVGLGSDFDGIWAFPVGLEKASMWQNVADGLRKRGHGEDVIRGIMHDNVRRVFLEAVDGAE